MRLVIVLCLILFFSVISFVLSSQQQDETNLLTEQNNNGMGTASTKQEEQHAKMSAGRISGVQANRLTVGAGCFWGTERFFSSPQRSGFKPGAVADVQVGYQGGSKLNPSYREVCSGSTGHAEVATLTFNPALVSYRDLLMHFFRFHDPTTLNQQGNDRGSQYRSAIFYHTPEQKEAAERLISEFNESGSELNITLKKAHGANAKIVTTVEDGMNSPFYAAEDYHQQYLDANPSGYCNHRLRW